MKSRIEALDYLRGVLAFSVMSYHYYVWSGSPHGADVLTTTVHDVLYKLGTYGVSSFYVLSGISLGHVYREMTLSVPQVRDFAIKRLFRIAPLYWLASLLSLALPLAVYVVGGDSSSLPSIGRAALNFSLLFSFLSPTDYLPTGGWSIGNELSFYVLFPVLVVAVRRGGAAAVSVILAATLPAIYFAFSILSPQAELSSQWASYVNPLNQLFLFAGGVLIARLHGRMRALSGRAASLLLFGLVLAFVIYPLGGNQIHIVTGVGRIYFSVICLGAGAVCLLMEAEIPRPLHSALAFLGAVSYSVYLLHPVVYRLLRVGLGWLGMTNGGVMVAASIPLTLLVSHLTYQYLERRLMRFGKRLASRGAPVAEAPKAAV